MSERRAQIQKAHALPKTRRCELLAVATLDGMPQQGEAFNLGSGIQPMFAGGPLGLDGTIPPLPCADHVRAETGSLGNCLDGIGVIHTNSVIRH